LLTLLCTVGPIGQCQFCAIVGQRQKAHQIHQLRRLRFRCRFRRARQLVWQVLRSCLVSLKMRNARGDDCTAKVLSGAQLTQRRIQRVACLRRNAVMYMRLQGRSSAIHAEHHTVSDCRVRTAPVVPHDMPHALQ